jgi:hypothetical protein
MNNIRAKIAAFWILCLLLCLLLCFSWHCRLLWLAVLLPVVGLIRLHQAATSTRVSAFRPVHPVWIHSVSGLGLLSRAVSLFGPGFHNSTDRLHAVCRSIALLHDLFGLRRIRVST